MPTNTKSEIKAQLSALVARYKHLCELLGDESNNSLLHFGDAYQDWYSNALKLVELLGSDRLAEFRSHYEKDPRRKGITVESYVLQDYVRGIGPEPDPFSIKESWKPSNAAYGRLTTQFQILKSLETRIDSVLEDVEGRLLSDLEDTELDMARKLLNTDIRAAGALAGVVLEGHLARVAENHDVRIRKNSTLSTINQVLRDSDVYGVVTWRKIQYLADVRNYCAHKKEREPTQNEVSELLSGVGQIIRTVF